MVASLPLLHSKSLKTFHLFYKSFITIILYYITFMLVLSSFYITFMLKFVKALSK